MNQNTIFNGYTLVGLFLVVLVIVSISSARERKAKLLEKLKNSYGKPSDRKYTSEDFKNIAHFYEKKRTGKQYIDDITWKDLSLDDIYSKINICNSSVGQEYLYSMLRIPEDNIERLKEIDRLAEHFDKNENDRINIQMLFSRLGFVKRISISDYIDLIVNLHVGSNIIHYICLLFLIASFVVCFAFNPVIGIFMIIAALSFSILSYYRYKAKVEPYFICIKQLMRMAGCAQELSSLNIKALEKYNEKLKSSYNDFKNISKNSWLLESGNVNGSFAEVGLDYIRMLTHVDLIKFNNSIRYINNKSKSIDSIMDCLGFIESAISIASFRRCLPYWSKPEIVNSSKAFIEADEIFHPLIKKPVSNSIKADQNILLTGSNASGKSTFLKTIALNAILSQSIYTSISNYTRMPFFRVYSSMSLNDDLSTSSSYYMVEIKALKRIIDAASDKGNKPVLCFVDEVLRGTNTVERIAASSEILKSFDSTNSLVFAATHDIELTRMLEGPFINYHFKEDVVDDSIIFNYKLFSGPATTRNAIKLLSILGYDKKITDNAERKANAFLNNGSWMY